MFKKRLIAYTFVIFWSVSLAAQNVLQFDGQVSGVVNYGPNNEAFGLVVGRYIPELYYDLSLDSTKNLYFEASANLYGNATFFKGDSVMTDGAIQPYRIWVRYTGKQYELRLGLQKIDFGSATMLRPLQWFNEIDPRDPLKLTNGVYGALGRYYLKNNANLWLWVLYGNENIRGLDPIKSYKYDPEFGGRFQHPVPKGELAITYHHRTANASEILNSLEYEQIPEDRYGIDGKWDIVVGFWLEGSYIRAHQDLGIFTNQTLLNIGADYTFGIGSGLNVVLEHLISGYDETSISFNNSRNTTATSISYPIGFFDRLNTVNFYSWDNNAYSFFLNYEHQFKKITGYVMTYYNPEIPQGIQENEFVNSFAGPGLRLMLVYNH